MGENLSSRIQRDKASVVARLSAFDADPDAVVAIDEDARIIYANEAAARLFGWHDPTLVGQDVTVLIPASHRARHKRAFSRYLATGEGRLFGKPLVFPALRSDGTTAQVEMLLHAVGQGLAKVVMAQIREAADTN